MDKKEIKVHLKPLIWEDDSVVIDIEQHLGIEANFGARLHAIHINNAERYGVGLAEVCAAEIANHSIRRMMRGT